MNDRDVLIQFNKAQKEWLNNQSKSTQAILKDLVNKEMKESQETNNETNKRK